MCGIIGVGATFFIMGGSIALAIASLAVIVWSFQVSFLYGFVALIGFEVMPFLILIGLVAQP